MTCNIENSWLKYPLTVKLKTLRTDDVNFLTLIYFLSQGQLFKILLGYYIRIIQHTDFTFVLKIDGKKWTMPKILTITLYFYFKVTLKISWYALTAGLQTWNKKQFMYTKMHYCCFLPWLFIISWSNKKKNTKYFQTITLHEVL